MSTRGSLFVLAVALSGAGASATAGEPGVIYQIKETGTPGTQCTVVSGPNKGKTGTYGDDANRSCCQKPMENGEEAPGNQWCTECRTGDGQSTGACKDKTRTIVSDHFGPLGDRAIVVDGYYQLPDGRTVHGITTVFENMRTRPVTTFYPIDVQKTDALRQSPDPVDRLIAESVEASAGSGGKKGK